MSDLKPYTSGYMKPPKEHQFKKGKSGNPKGRPKKKNTLASSTLKVLNRKIRIKGADQKVSLTHAFALRLRDLAVQGYQPAIDIVRSLDDQTSVNRRSDSPEEWTVRAHRELAEAGYQIVDGDIVPIDGVEKEETQNE